MPHMIQLGEVRPLGFQQQACGRIQDHGTGALRMHEGGIQFSLHTAAKIEYKYKLSMSLDSGFLSYLTKQSRCLLNQS